MLENVVGVGHNPTAPRLIPLQGVDVACEAIFRSVGNNAAATLEIFTNWAVPVAWFLLNVNAVGKCAAKAGSACLLSPVPCPLSPVLCPLFPVPCPLSPAPCPLSPASCPLQPIPCPLPPATNPLSPAPCPLSAFFDSFPWNCIHVLEDKLQ